MRRQILLFLAVGLLQYGIDALLFALLFFLGSPVAVSNVLARAIAAVAGFQINGTVTFRSQRGESPWGLTHGLRFLLLWLGMTAISTMLMMLAEHSVTKWGLGREWVLGAKLLIEGFLALLGFALAKWWVYRR